jgi:hypothetical protein
LVPGTPDQVSPAKSGRSRQYVNEKTWQRDDRRPNVARDEHDRRSLTKHLHVGLELIE